MPELAGHTASVAEHGSEGLPLRQYGKIGDAMSTSTAFSVFKAKHKQQVLLGCDSIQFVPAYGLQTLKVQMADEEGQGMLRARRIGLFA